MRILIIDNYDSFTYNLQHYVEQFADDITVARNDAISIEEAEPFTHYILSPGPGLPAQAGITMAIIEKYHATRPILGVCLGCQAIAQFFGASLYNQQLVAHGIKRPIQKTKEQSVLLMDFSETFEVGLYHSWAIEENSLPKDFKVAAKSTSGVVMAIEHNAYPLYGVQFHPESIMSENGIIIIENWLKTTCTKYIDLLRTKN